MTRGTVRATHDSAVSNMRAIVRSSGRRLPAILAAAASVFLAAPAAGQNIRLTRPDFNVLELTGGVGSAEWRMRYGTSPSPPNSNIFRAGVYSAGVDRAYFSHGGWLRLIDTQQGVVLGRWHFPCAILNVTPDGERANVQMDCVDPPTPRVTITTTFDPRSAQLPPWPPASLLSLRLPNIESGPQVFGTRGPFCSATPLTADTPAAARIERAESAIRQDPFDPWFRLLLARLLRGQSDPRASAVFADAVQTPTADFTELFPLSACLEVMGETDAARAAYERGYGDFVRRGQDPRLVTILITRLILYSPFNTALRPDIEHRDELIERIYRLSPGAEGSELGWRFHADDLERRGRHAEAQIWRARAEESESRGLRVHSLSWLRNLDRVFLITAAAVFASLCFFGGLYIKYVPQRRVVRPVRVRSLRLAPASTTFNLAFWSRRERATFGAIVLIGWIAAGVGSVYSRVALREMSAPIGPTLGGLGGASIAQYIESSLWPTPERDLLLAMSAQANGELATAERLYRGVPQFAEAWNNLGVIFKTSGRDREAQEAFERALQIDSSLGEAAWNARRGSPTFWTTVHQQYAADRPMTAPPPRDQIARAYLGMSPWGVSVRAFAGPFANVVYLRTGAGRSFFGSPTTRLQAAAGVYEAVGNDDVAVRAWIVAVSIMLLLSVMTFVIPVREVTQPPPNAFGVLEFIVPGVSPYWRAAAAPVLLVWSYAALCTWVLFFRQTPYFLTGTLTPGLARAYGVDNPPAEVVSLIGPDHLVVYGSLAALLLINVIAVWRWKHAAR
jgi:tetratricopeptide (TPR) repeat protein